MSNGPKDRATHGICIKRAGINIGIAREMCIASLFCHIAECAHQLNTTGLWSAPPIAHWLEASMQEGSLAFFGKPLGRKYSNAPYAIVIVQVYG